MTVKRLSILIAIAISLISWNCRKQLEPTEVDMSEYGWVLYANGFFCCIGNHNFIIASERWILSDKKIYMGSYHA